MTNSNSINYATKVWLASVLFSPILFIGFVGVEDGFQNLGSTIAGYFMFVLTGAVFSIPCWLLFMLVVNAISKMESRTQDKKILINVLAIVIGSSIFLIIFQDIDAMGFALPYLVSLTIAIWYFELNIHNQQATPTMIDHLIE